MPFGYEEPDMPFGYEDAGYDVGDGGDDDHGEEAEGCLERVEGMEALETGRV